MGGRSGQESVLEIYLACFPFEANSVHRISMKGLFKSIFRVRADTSAIVEEKSGPNGGVFYRCTYELVLWFGGPEVKAQFAWKENVSSTFHFGAFSEYNFCL